MGPAALLILSSAALAQARFVIQPRPPAASPPIHISVRPAPSPLPPSLSPPQLPPPPPPSTPYVDPHASYPSSIFKPVHRDCLYQEWEAWSDCAAACNSVGFQRRIRTIIKGASGLGQQCDQDALQQTQPCQGPPCPPQDCVMGSWGSWTPCSATCDSGSRSRSRSIVSQSAFGGAPCLDTFESEVCLDRPCPVDCQMSPWSEWSVCSATCDEGRRQRIRTVFVQAANGGLACGPLEEFEACNEGSCAVDCQMGPWSAWSDCSADCGDGLRQRLRNILVEPQNGGLACPPLEEWEACTNGPCARDCVIGQWSSWSDCPTCGVASRSRSRSILEQAAFGGLQCPLNLAESEPCQIQPCPVDCVPSPWSPYSACSATCGEGRRQRIRNILTQAQYGGIPCGPLEEFDVCNEGPCEVHCQVSEWSPWSECSASCGFGSQQRLRSLIQRPANGGELCPELEEWRSCTNGPCQNEPPVSSYSVRPSGSAQPSIRLLPPQPAPPQPKPSLFARVFG